MPSNSKLFVKPFIGGLNTELSSVEDAVLYTADEVNCTILPEGIKGRRLGFNIERDGQWSEGEETDSYSGFYWTNVNKSDTSFIVKQKNTVLEFYNASTKPFTTVVGTVDISKYTNSTANDEIGPLRYAVGAGSLFIVNEKIAPLIIDYDLNTETNQEEFFVQPFSLFIRDTEGLDDGLEIDKMPKASSTDSDPFGGLSCEHMYNLLNQGWSEDDLIQFAKDKFKWPSNNLQWFIGKDDSGEYKTELLLKEYFGNTPAPKGHFVLDYFRPDRSDVSGVTALGNATIGKFYKDTAYVKNRSLRGTEIKYCEAEFEGSLTDSLKSFMIRFDNLYRKTGKKARDWLWSGKVLIKIYGGIGVTESVKKKRQNRKIVTESIWEAESWKFLQEEEFYVYGAGPYGENPHYERFTTDWDDEAEKYKRYKIKVYLSDGNADTPNKLPYFVSFSVYGYFSDKDGDIRVETRQNFVKDIAYMPGRLFYLVDDTILFSQTLEDWGSNFEKCYQSADPTSENISDVLPTDGGMIQINNMGKGRALKTFNRGVLVFGTNAVYGIISPRDKLFTATEYDVIELSRAGIVGDLSAVSTDSTIYYWSSLGIFKISINPNTGSSIIAESVTHTTIQEWYDRIPERAKETCVGEYDFVNNRIYWYYKQEDEDSEEEIKGFNRCLVYDLTYNSFMPFKLEGDKYIVDVFSSTKAYEISPTMYIRVNGEKVVTNNMPVIAAEEDTEFKRWTSLQHIIADKNGNTSFGDYNSREYKDFDNYEYDSYMVSRPIMFAGFSTFGNMVSDTYSDKQVPVLQTLFKRTEQAPLTPVVKPVEHTYKLKDDVSFISDVNYDITSGTLSKHSIAKAFIYNDKGLFKSCKLRVDVRDFKGKSIDIAAEIIGDNKSLQNVIMYHKPINTDYINIELNDPLEEPHKDYVVRVVAEVCDGEVSKEKIHFTADFVQDRVSPSLPVFAGFEEVVVEDTERMYDVGDFFKEYKLNTKIPSMYMTSFQIEAMPVLNTDKNWRIVWGCSTDSNSNLFYTDRSVNYYGTSSKDTPVETSYDSSIMRVNNLSNMLSISVSNSNIDKNEWESMKVRYKLTGLVPIYKEAASVKKNIDYMAASGANIRMRWGWALDDRSNRWDMVQNGYRPQKDFLHDEYVESRIHVRGRGKAFQVEIRNDNNKDFRLAGMNLLVRSK